MTAVIIDGKHSAAKLRAEVADKVATLKEQGIVPGIVSIIVGNDPASKTYLKNKQKVAQQMGFHADLLELEETISQQMLMDIIEGFNHNPRIHGIVVQMPLPKHMNTKEVMLSIKHEKDIDGFHPHNLGMLVHRDEHIIPSTPRGVMRLLRDYNVDLKGKKVVVVGQSTIVGRPLALLALDQQATVTVCTSNTPDLKKETLQADVLFSAAGKIGLITAEHVKEGAVVIDVGVNYDENGRMCGDVCFEEVSQKASMITPVPGGIGPMTVASIFEQTYLNTVDIIAKKS